MIHLKMSMPTDGCNVYKCDIEHVEKTEGDK